MLVGVGVDVDVESADMAGVAGFQWTLASGAWWDHEGEPDDQWSGSVTACLTVPSTH